VIKKEEGASEAGLEESAPRPPRKARVAGGQHSFIKNSLKVGLLFVIKNIFCGAQCDMQAAQS